MWENCQMYALKLFWNVHTRHVLEDLIFYGQWTNLHDRSQNGPKLVTNDYLVWSLTFVINVITNNIVMWETLPNNVYWDCFKTPILQEILRIQNLHQVEHCAFFASHTFVPISWMCKKQTSVSHSSTESEIISLDAGLRLDSKPALDLWDLIVAVLHGNTYQSNQERWDLCTNLVCAALRKLETRKKSHGMNDDLDNVDFLSSNVHSSCVDIKGLVMSTRILRCIREPRGWCPYPHGCDRMWRITVRLGIREEAGRQTVSPRPSQYFDLWRN